MRAATEVDDRRHYMKTYKSDWSPLRIRVPFFLGMVASRPCDWLTPGVYPTFARAIGSRCRCFVASEAVDWLVEEAYCSTRQEAVDVCQHMLK
eukprot:8894451-Pyramimonas_sp.AAC.1